MKNISKYYSRGNEQFKSNIFDGIPQPSYIIEIYPLHNLGTQKRTAAEQAPEIS